MSIPKRSASRLTRLAILRGVEITREALRGRCPEFPPFGFTDRLFSYANKLFVYRVEKPSDDLVLVTVLPCPFKSRVGRGPWPFRKAQA